MSLTALESGAVHIWAASLADPRWSARTLRPLLSADELARASRLKLPLQRQRFEVSRGLLRSILSEYLDTPPDRIAFTYGSHGKPALRDHALHFSVAHSDDLAVYAIARDREVGIDVEAIREIEGIRAIVDRFFTLPEMIELTKLPPRLHAEAFANCWTRKEAYLKATGLGCSHPLDQVCVSLAPGTPAQLKWVANRPAESGRWSLAAFRPAGNHIAAIAVEGPAADLIHHQWPASWNAEQSKEPS